MALFDINSPQQQYFTPLQEATGEDRKMLALLGYRGDGSQNLLGKITSWIPGVGVLANARADSVAKSAGLKGVAANISDDAENRRAKLMAQIGIIGGVVSLATGTPTGILGGINSIGSSLGSVAGLSGPNRADDGLTSYR